MIQNDVIGMTIVSYQVDGIQHPTIRHTEITIEATGGLNPDGTRMPVDSKWAIRLTGMVLNKKGQWEFEPIPSSRSDAFLKRARFDSADEALMFLVRAAKG